MEKSKKGCEECFEIQNINLEDNAPPVTEKEASTEIKQAVPLLLQTLKAISENTIKSIPKAANPTKRKSTKRNKKRNDEIIDDDLISVADEDACSSAEEEIIAANDNDSEEEDTLANGKDKPTTAPSNREEDSEDEDEIEIKIKGKSATSDTISSTLNKSKSRKRKIAEIEEDIPKNEDTNHVLNKMEPSIWKKTKMDIEYLNSLDQRVLRSSNVGTSSKRSSKSK